LSSSPAAVHNFVFASSHDDFGQSAPALRERQRIRRWAIPIYTSQTDAWDCSSCVSFYVLLGDPVTSFVCLEWKVV